MEQALELFGLGAVAQTNPRDLGYSGRKRVALASTVAMQTPVLVFDEPTAGLDANEQEQLSRVIDHLREQGKTVLVISHDMDFLLENFDRFVLLRAGQVVLDAGFQAFFSRSDILQACGLVAPQMVRLSHALGREMLAATVEHCIIPAMPCRKANE